MTWEVSGSASEMKATIEIWNQGMGVHFTSGEGSNGDSSSTVSWDMAVRGQLGVAILDKPLGSSILDRLITHVNCGFIPTFPEFEPDVPDHVCLLRVREPSIWSRFCRKEGTNRDREERDGHEDVIHHEAAHVSLC